MVYWKGRWDCGKGERGVSGEAYELLAMLMRYVFVLLGLLILWRALRWLRRDAKAYRREMRTLPDAGLVGEMVNLKTGESCPLPREGTIGSARACDIRVKGYGVLRNHARFAFEEGKGLRVTPSRRGKTLMAGVELKGPAHALHGTQLQVGDALLRVRLFAGLNVPHPAQFQPMPDQLSPEDWETETMPDAFASPFSAVPQEEFIPEEGEDAPAYEGNYTDDGQMTWQYAYSLEELRQAQQAGTEMTDWQPLPPPPEDPQEDEALPYESPIPRRRRRRRS